MLHIDCFASGSAGNLYRVDDGRTKLLLECGVPFREVQRHLAFRTTGISACLVTHEHKDHSRAVRDMLRLGIPCCMSKGTAAALGIMENPAVRIVADREPFQVRTWSVLPFATQHDAAEPLGFLLDSGAERVLYATDTYYIRYKFPPCTVILIECNHAYDIVDRRVEEGKLDRALAKRLVRSHMSLENLVEFFHANDLSSVREIHLLHLSDQNADEARFQQTIAALTGKPVYVA